MIVSGTIPSAATTIAQALTGNVTLAGNAHAVCSVIAAPTSVKQKQVTTPPSAVATLTVPVARAVTSESVVLSVERTMTVKASNLVALVKTTSVSPTIPVTITTITIIRAPAKQTVTVKMESSASLASAKNPHVKPTQSALVVKSVAAASVAKVVPLITTVATVKSATPVDAKLESVAMTQTVQQVQSVA